MTLRDAAIAPAGELRLRRDEIRVRARSQPGAEQGDEQRRHERADGGPRHEPRRTRQVERARVARDFGEPAAGRDRDELCARSTALDAIDTVSSVSPEYDTAIASVSGPTKAGVRICFSTESGTGSSSLNAAAATSPEIPEPPMPSTTTLRIVSLRGKASA